MDHLAIDVGLWAIAACLVMLALRGFVLLITTTPKELFGVANIKKWYDAWRAQQPVPVKRKRPPRP